MRHVDLPSPGLLSNGIKLRITAAKAISQLEILKQRSASAGPSITKLREFFEAAAAACEDIEE